MTDYSKTVAYWEKAFAEPHGFVMGAALPFPEIEAGLSWLCEGAEGIVDFGCGRGTLLFRCLSLGVRSVVGIDTSPRAISFAENTAAEARGIGMRKFILGDVSSLESFKDRSFDGAILSNIIDNLHPHDARGVWAGIIRLIKPGGRIFLKLNDHQNPSRLRDDLGCQLLVGTDFYQEPSGLYLWNLSEEAVKRLVEPELEIEQSFRVEFKEHRIWNRLYLLRKNN